ncbi:MAG TPA: class I SAM-dependent methyltransferase [Stellaceae bacterium]|jgi:precorrin-6B methylase 2
MDFPTFQAELRRIGGTVHAFAAIGAALRLHQAKQQADPAVEAPLLAAVEAVLPGALDGLDPRQVSAALAYITLVIEDATELFNNAARPPGWVLRDPAILQAQGQASRQNIRGIIALASDRPRLAASLSGRFLDVGTGVGAMALEAADQCPSLQVVGIDIWEPSLGLARANVAASPHAARIEIRAQDVTQLDELAAYTLAWLPAPFLPRPVAEAALDRLAVALAPKGHLVVGLYAVPTDKAGAALTALRVVRSGGHLWDIAEMEQQLRVRGFVDVETCLIPPTTFVIGRRP